MDFGRRRQAGARCAPAPLPILSEVLGPISHDDQGSEWWSVAADCGKICGRGKRIP
jgi:hypothetical protein